MMSTRIGEISRQIAVLSQQGDALSPPVVTMSFDRIDDLVKYRYTLLKELSETPDSLLTDVGGYGGEGLTFTLNGVTFKLVLDTRR